MLVNQWARRRYNITWFNVKFKVHGTLHLVDYWFFLNDAPHHFQEMFWINVTLYGYTVCVVKDLLFENSFQNENKTYQIMRGTRKKCNERTWRFRHGPHIRPVINVQNSSFTGMLLFIHTYLSLFCLNWFERAQRWMV